MFETVFGRNKKWKQEDDVTPNSANLSHVRLNWISNFIQRRKMTDNGHKLTAFANPMKDDASGFLVGCRKRECACCGGCCCWGERKRKTEGGRAQTERVQTHWLKSTTKKVIIVSLSLIVGCWDLVFVQDNYIQALSLLLSHLAKLLFLSFCWFAPSSTLSFLRFLFWSVCNSIFFDAQRLESRS